MGKRKKSVKTVNVDYIVYTDGGCAYNPGGPGGCAAVVINKKTEERVEYREAYESTTNNRMEIMAVILAMESIPEGHSVILHSDSTYVLNTMDGKYRKNKNIDLWKRLDRAIKGKEVITQWVKGHSGILENERCDQLCLEAINSQEKKIDSGYLADREEGRKFYEKIERSPQGAMGVQIELPEPFASEKFSFCSPNEYCERYQVHRECAKSILNFYMIGNSSFKSYLSIKTGGVDYWSRKSGPFIAETLEDQGLSEETMLSLKNMIKAYISPEKEQLSCLRWYMRGLTLQDCIRKVLVIWK